MSELPPVEASSGELPEMARAKILIVDDDERTQLAVSTVLEELGQTLVVAGSGEEALRHLLHDDYAVILLDLHMPGMDGYETASLIRARKRTRHIPIVFLTAVFRDDSHTLQAYSSGAVDMVFKPVDPFILKSKVSVFVDLYLKQVEIQREAELRHRLQEENFRVTTEKLLAEQALRISQERQEAILRSLPVCFHSRTTDYPFATIFVSAAVEHVTGFASDRFVDDPEFGLSRIHPEDVGRVIDALQGASATGSYSTEFRWCCADGSYRVFFDQGVLAPVDDAEKPREIFGTIVDVTERRLLEQQLAQSQKMETVGQLTGGVAHDFNNLLTVILGNIDLLERQSPGDARLMRKLAAMRHAAERGHSLTSQLLAFSRRQHLSPEIIDVNALVQKFAPLIRHAVGETVAVELALAEIPTVCEVDPSHLEASLLNLAVNARDAMPNGGALAIHVRQVEHADELVAQNPEATAGPWITLSIRDTGTGMSKDIQDRAFEPFFTTKSSGKGTGLGLSQVYGFVRQSGGFVTLASAPGDGTNLSIYLRPSTRQLTTQAERVIKPGETTPRTESVLLVEDNAAVLALTREMLVDLGYTVMTAIDASSALKVLETDATIDVLFTDVVMPGGKTGVQLAREARELRPSIKILLTSGYTGEALKRHQGDRSHLPLIAKPFRQPDLAMQLRKVIEAEPGVAVGSA